MKPVSARSLRVSIAFSPSEPTITGRAYSLSSSLNEALWGMPDRAKLELSRLQRKVRDAAMNSRALLADYLGFRQGREIAIDLQPPSLALLRVELGRE